MTPQVAFVTGGGSGIGAAVVRAAARTGAIVAAVDADPAALHRTAEHVRAARQGEVLALEADVRDEAALETAVARCLAELGVPTAVLANAGVERNLPADRLALADWNQTIDTNLTGTFLVARICIREMQAANLAGSVVCTSSPAAFVGFAGGGNAAYAASKGGVSAMVRSLALDYARCGIRVNALVPGATDTPMLTADEEPDNREARRAKLIAEAADQIPLGRLGTAGEMAEAVMWLWSSSAAYVTGSHLVVDGGLLAKGANTF